MVSLTDKERQFLSALYDEADGSTSTAWFTCVTDRLSFPLPSHGGIVGSLVKKGLVTVDFQDGMETINLTQTGLDTVEAKGV